MTPGVSATTGKPTGNVIRLFLIDTASATNVAGWPSLRGREARAVSKRLLLDLATLHNDDGSPLALDNIEGLSWGPELDGKRTLLLVGDNNFSGHRQTRFIAPCSRARSDTLRAAPAALAPLPSRPCPPDCAAVVAQRKPDTHLADCRLPPGGATGRAVARAAPDGDGRCHGGAPAPPRAHPRAHPTTDASPAPCRCACVRRPALPMTALAVTLGSAPPARPRAGPRYKRFARVLGFEPR